jgi:hypothetical protein
MQFIFNFCHKNVLHIIKDERKKVTLSYVKLMFSRFSKTSVLKENMSKSRNLFLPLASEMERNC